MSEEKKKISFGFSKLVKKPNIVPSAQPKPTETIEFIKCVEDNNIQVLNEVKIEEEKVLVIPMRPSHSSSDSKEKIKLLPPENSVDEVKPQTLEELAAKEIVNEVNNMKKEVEETSGTFVVPLVSNPPVGEEGSTLDDYENIPIEKFGLAMLRGMGFKPEEGIGKNAKIAPPVEPVLRPKGMGLGADKALKATSATVNESKDLKLCTGSFVRLISGTNKDSYGKVEGFIEESGRVIVRLARVGSTVIVGEFMLSLVTPDEYSKNAKVLNIAKYEKYKANEKTSSEIVSDGSDQESSKQSQYSASCSTSNHRSRHENGSSRYNERYRSRNDSEGRRDRDSSRRDNETRRHHSDRRHETSERYHHKSSKHNKYRDRSPRRD